MSEIADGGPAFPSANDVVVGNIGTPGHSGMTLRDYFAAKALQAMVSQPTWETCPVEKVSCWAYEYADAMLKAREA